MSVENHAHHQHSIGSFFGILEHSIMVSGFVLVMMLLIEYLTVQSKGNWHKIFQKNIWLQVIFASLLGAIPGCLGTFVIVSLYAHKLLNFAAIVAVMIASSGDEAFVMFSVIPQEALIIQGSILLIAIAVGFILNLFMKKRTLMYLPENHLKFHRYNPDCHCFDKKNFWQQLQKISFHRALLMTGGLLFLIFLLAGRIGPHDWNWKKYTFLITTLIGLFIVTTVPDHFLKEHLWEHTIKKHLLRLFLWTFGAFLVIHLLEEYIDISHWLKNNYWIVLSIAVLIGIIPESGPHIVFISLFSTGFLPLPILMANSIVQDGHGAIPLLAESKKSFLAVKAVNVLVGFLIGAIGYFFI